MDVIQKVDHAFIGISHSDQFDLIILVMIDNFVKSQSGQYSWLQLGDETIAIFQNQISDRWYRQYRITFY